MSFDYVNAQPASLTSQTSADDSQSPQAKTTPMAKPVIEPVVDQYYHHPYPTGGNKPPRNYHPVDKDGPEATHYAHLLLMHRLQLPVYSIESRNWITAHPNQIGSMNRNILFMWLATVYQDSIWVLRQLDELQRQANRSEHDLERILFSLKKARLMLDRDQQAKLFFLALELAKQYEAEDLQTALTPLAGHEVLSLMTALNKTKTEVKDNKPGRKILQDSQDAILFLLATQEHKLEDIFAVLLR